MKRSGSTLHYQLVKEIVESKKLGKGVGWTERDGFADFIAKYGDQDLFLVVKCHNFVKEAGELLSSGKAKGIYVYRDLRDVIVSMMNKTGSSFSQIMRSNFLTSILSDYKSWKQFDGILISSYEEMLENLPDEVLRIAHHLGIEISNTTAATIAKKYSIDNQKDRIKDFDYAKHGKAADGCVYNPYSLLHHDHIHSGKVGTWKASLLPLEVALLEKREHWWFQERSYSLSQTWMIRLMAWLVYGAKEALQSAWHTTRMIRYPFRTIEYLFDGSLIDKIRSRYHEHMRRRREAWWFSKAQICEHVDVKIQSKVHMRLYFQSDLSKLVYCEDFEKQERQFLNAFLRPGDTFVDIGANIGLFALIAAARVGASGRVIAFEPTNETFGRLEENVALNHFNNVSCHCVAVSDKPGEMPFSVSHNGFDDYNSFAPPIKGGSFTTTSVQCTSWNDFATEHGLIGKVTMMKIDVEGWEEKVLQGGRCVFSRQDAPLLQVEFTDAASESAGTTCQNIYRLLEELGYAVFSYDRRRNRIIPDPMRDKYPYVNLIATKDPDAVVTRIR
jgi:FkbM family methyltransferase